jgi:hypothetical protein
MIHGRRVRIVASIFGSSLLVACQSPSTPSAPASQTVAPPRTPPSSSGITVFTDSMSGVSTSDLHDVNDQILQLSTAGELVWTADNTRLPGYTARTYTINGVSVHTISGNICPQGCDFEVRFGNADGERRAYLTVDYGHDNPGTIVDVEVAGGQVIVNKTNVFPPGAPVLSGTVFELTRAGQVAIRDAKVAVGISSGWRYAETDRQGFYRIEGLIDTQAPVHVTTAGYATKDTSVMISGDTSFDIVLARP